jgi:gluconolactonase
MEWETCASGYGLAEAPTVDTDGTLLFSDVLGGGVYRVHGDGRVDTVVPKRRGVGGIVLHAAGGFVCSGRDLIHVRDGETNTVLHVDGVAGWNDIGTAPDGALYAGALRFPVFDPKAEVVPGELWRLDGAGAAVAFGDVVHANGVVCASGGTVYLSDTRAQRLIVWDGGTRRDVDVSAHGHPDGMALDEHGALWLALVEGGIGRFTPEGVLDRRVEVPAPVTTSVCFDGRDLYVTTNDGVLRTTVDVGGMPLTPFLGP